MGSAEKFLEQLSIGYKCKKIWVRGRNCASGIVWVETRGMRSIERRVIVLKIKCFRSIERITRMDSVRKVKVCRRVLREGALAG